MLWSSGFLGKWPHSVSSLHRTTSLEAAQRFPPRSLDWVYLDAMHFRDAVTADLDAYAPLVKDDGFLCGHDYASNTIAAARGFGVVEAVNAFVERTGYRLVLVTNELFPSYVIAKNVHSEAYLRFERKLLGYNFLKIKRFLNRRYQQEICADAAGKILKAYAVME